MVNICEEIIFLRKSRSDNAKESVEETLARHESQLQEYALREFGHYIPEENIYREVVSGGERLEDRPVFQQVLKRIEDKDIKKLLCVDTARISRSGIYGAGDIINYIRFSKVLLCTLGKTYNLEDEFDRKFLEMEMLNSSQFLDYSKQVLARGRRHSIAIGNFVGSKAPFGYKKFKLQDEKGYILAYNHETEYVRLIFDMYLNGNGTTTISNHLNTLDIKPSRNEIWTPEIVRNILHNVTYAGFLTWEKRKTIIIVENGVFKKVRPLNKEHTLVKGRHEAIVTIEEFDRVQRTFASHPSSKVKSDVKLQNPLSSIVKCSHCGRTMIRQKYEHKKPKRVYDIDKKALSNLIRVHKEKTGLTLTDIQNELNLTRAKVISWFNPNINKMAITKEFSEKWYDLKRLLNIKTNKFDKALTTFEIPIEYYLICPTSQCKNTATKIEEIEYSVISHLKGILEEFHYFLDNYEEEQLKVIEGNKKQLEKIDKQIDELLEQKQTALLDFNSRDIDREEYLFLKKDIQDKINVLTNKREKYADSEIEDKIIKIKKAIPILSLCIKDYYTLNTKDKNELLKVIIDSAVYTKEKQSTRNNKVDFDLEIHLKI